MSRFSSSVYDSFRNDTYTSEPKQTEDIRKPLSEAEQRSQRNRDIINYTMRNGIKLQQIQNRQKSAEADLSL